MYLRLERFKYTKDTTIGKLYVNGEYFGYTLEDTVRPYGIKVKAHTAIPETIDAEDCDQPYSVAIRFSPSFKRDMPVIYDKIDNGAYIIVRNFVSFLYVMFHGGNDHEDTEGCPLVARSWDGRDKIHGSLESDLTALIKAEIEKGRSVSLSVRNLPQSS